MQDDEQAIRQLLTTWLDASKAGDTGKVLSLMTEDVVFLVTGQPPMRGKAAFAAAQAAFKNAKIEASAEIQEIKVLGDWAYMWAKLSVVITPAGGATISSDQRGVRSAAGQARGKIRRRRRCARRARHDRLIIFSRACRWSARDFSAAPPRSRGRCARAARALAGGRSHEQPASLRGHAPR